jgi:hypothetical protein
MDLLAALRHHDRETPTAGNQFGVSVVCLRGPTSRLQQHALGVHRGWSQVAGESA